MTLSMMAARYGGPDVLEPFDVEVPQPGPGQVTIEVRAAGVNPTDWKGITGSAYGGDDPDALPKPLGYEVAGMITAIGADTEIGSGGGAVGDAVLAYRIIGGYSAALTVPASDVFAKPEALGFPEAANLLLVGTTAAEMLHVVQAKAGETIVVHGASGATGVSVLDVLRRFGAEPVRYGDGLERRIVELAPDGVAAALDCVGTDEAVDVSLALVPDRSRIVTIAAAKRAQETGIRWIVGRQPPSQAYRNSQRRRLIDLAAEGKLVVPMARTFPLREAAAALTLLKGEHPGGKLALIP
jgi:NADPH:quinone reductase-like Zn-dependent oxidoreductase